MCCNELLLQHTEVLRRDLWLHLWLHMAARVGPSWDAVLLLGCMLAMCEVKEVCTQQSAREG